MTTWQEFASRAIRVPFTEKGRSYEGWDCWGLVCCGYRDVLDVDLPGYESSYETTLDMRRLAQTFTRERDFGYEQCERTVGAIALMARRSRPVHVGLVVSDRYVIHCEQGVGTVRQPDSRLMILSFWRPESVDL